jgi:hypothetical protein
MVSRYERNIEILDHKRSDVSPQLLSRHNSCSALMAGAQTQSSDDQEMCGKPLCAIQAPPWSAISNS